MLPQVKYGDKSALILESSFKVNKHPDFYEKQ